MQRSCPHCGAPLPEDAAFCPACARDIHPRKKARTPVPLRNKLLLAGLILVLLAGGLGAAAWIKRPYQPQTVEGEGGAYYTWEGTTYQLVLGWAEDRFSPVPEIRQPGEVDTEYHMPSRLFVNLTDSGQDGGEAFLALVEEVTVSFPGQEDNPHPFLAAPPAPDDASPEATLVSALSWMGDSGTGTVEWVFHMKNGDTIILRQAQIIDPVHTYNYHYEDFPMETTVELQALLDRLSEEIDPDDNVNLYLPPVTYQGGVDIDGRTFNFYGSEADGQRTTFTGTVRVAYPNSWICYFYDIDFVGDGSGVGVSATARAILEGCTFSNWRTGVLAYGEAWVNVADCAFTGNEVGFHFNSAGEAVIGDVYRDNLFTGNTTAILLERVSSNITLDLSGCRFSDNGTDIDNRCDQPLNLTRAIFE